ncbi:MAG: serine/threonine-protein kinase [Acidobacteriota bacterium]
MLGRALMRALELEGDAQRSFVADFGREHPALLEELEAMLAVEEMATDFLAASAAAEIGAPEPDWGSECPGAELDAVGERWIGPYRLLELLGAGGMGEVYLAEQYEPLERRVALKLVRRAVLDDEAQLRLSAERAVLQRLEHPNIARILDAGTAQDGRPFFALEVIDGQRIDAYCRDRGLDLRGRIELMISVCRGLDHAHRRRIIHHDLKPTNILVSDIDGAAVPKIIDFGIAESLDRPASVELSGKIYGTPAYMSPEALRGDLDIDTRTDVYSLGVLLYQLLAGLRPFDGSSYAELRDQVSSEEPPAPSTRFSSGIDRDTAERVAEERKVSRSALRRQLGGDLGFIARKAVARDVDDRYDSAAALARDLRQFLGRRPVAARPGGVGYRAGLWLSRHRWPTAAAALALLALLGLAAQALLARARAAELAQVSQELTRQVERAEWRLRVASLLPTHDLTPEIEAIRSDIASLEAKSQDLYSGNRGLAAYALGRSALSVGDLKDARRHLEAAWGAGYRRPEVSVALGRTLGRLYEEALDASVRTSDRATRDAMRDLAERTLRDPALVALSRAAGAGELPELLTARVAYYRDDLDGALDQARAAARRDPGLFEAKFLEAQILERQADQRQRERAESLELFDAARTAAREGLAIARSSPEGHLRLCRIESSHYNYVTSYGLQDLDDGGASVEESCGRAASVAPGQVESRLAIAMAIVNRIENEVWDQRKDPSPSLAELTALVEPLRGSERRVAAWAEVERYLGLGHYSRGTFLEQTGEDPTAALNTTIEHFAQALRLGADTHQVHHRLAVAYAERANYQMHRGLDPREDLALASRSVESAIALESDSAVAQGHLALVQIRLAEYLERAGEDPSDALGVAAAASQKAVELDPGRVGSFSAAVVIGFMRGRWFEKTGRDGSAHFMETLAWAGKAQEAFPLAFFADFMAGQTHLELARSDVRRGLDPSVHAAEARRLYAGGLGKVAGLPGPYIELADLNLVEATFAVNTGQDPRAFARRALDHAAKALELDADRADAVRLRGEGQTLLARDAAARGDVDRARRLFAAARTSLEQARAGAPEDARNALALAMWTWRRHGAGFEPADGELADALAAAEEARRLDRRLTEALAVEGALLTLRPETRDRGLTKLADATRENKNLAREWHRLQETAPPLSD